MRHTHSLLLVPVLCFLLSIPAVATSTAGSAAYTDGDRIVYREAVDTLSRLGVISGKEDGSFDPQGLITRAECAKLLASMRCGGDFEKIPTEELKIAFSDTAGHWAEKQISYCADRGILNGRGDDLFDPDAVVTEIEFAKMALATLGYDPTAFQLVGLDWIFNTNIALQFCDPSLYTGLEGDIKENDPLTRERAAQILFNMLDNPIQEAVLASTAYPGETIYEYRTRRDEQGQAVPFYFVYFNMEKWAILSAG